MEVYVVDNSHKVPVGGVVKEKEKLVIIRNKKKLVKTQKDKGKRGEAEIAHKFKDFGFDNAHRSQQYSGKGESSADVVGVDGLHLEVKLGYKYSKIYEFREQAERDSKGSGNVPVVCCRMDRHPWLAVLDLDDFIEIWQDANAWRNRHE